MERWVSNAEIREHLGISVSTLYRLCKQGYFSKGTHFRHKDPLNTSSHRVWRRTAVDQMLSYPDHVLRRRVDRTLQKKIGSNN
tara:strand:- start:790 stop:1038 length:249 start_codon:yes stop_codon:yes gene_type:complete